MAASAGARTGPPCCAAPRYWHARGPALAAVLGGSRWVWNAGLLDGYVADARLGLVGASARLGFRLREVLLVGRERVSRDAVLAASELDLGSPTLALDPESIRARLERNRWIKSARVTTRLPDTVFIEIEERRPPRSLAARRAAADDR